MRTPAAIDAPAGAAASAAPTIAYFGYGSLVNDRTRPAGLAVARARLAGFRRAWRVRGGIACALTIVADAAASVRGLVVTEPAENLAALDAREVRYRRAAIGQGALAHDDGAAAGDVFYYAVEPAHDGPGDGGCPILLSYVDCVLQGFLDHWGEAGVAEFMATTDGWDVPVRDDRDAPLYPRAQPLSARERAIVDAALEAAGARRFRPSRGDG